MFRSIRVPTTALITTETDTKAPRSFGPFKGGLKCRRTMRVLFNFEQDDATLQRVGPDYFRKVLPWQILEEGCPVISNKEGSVYVRFLIEKIEDEVFIHEGKVLSWEDVKNYLPKRATPDEKRPLFICVKLENIKKVSL